MGYYFGFVVAIFVMVLNLVAILLKNIFDTTNFLQHVDT